MVFLSCQIQNTTGFEPSSIIQIESFARYFSSTVRVLNKIRTSNKILPLIITSMNFKFSFAFLRCQKSISYQITDIKRYQNCRKLHLVAYLLLLIRTILEDIAELKLLKVDFCSFYIKLDKFLARSKLMNLSDFLDRSNTLRNLGRTWILFRENILAILFYFRFLFTFAFLFMVLKYTISFFLFILYIDCLICFSCGSFAHSFQSKF